MFLSLGWHCGAPSVSRPHPRVASRADGLVGSWMQEIARAILGLVMTPTPIDL